MGCQCKGIGRREWELWLWVALWTRRRCCHALLVYVSRKARMPYKKGHGLICTLLTGCPVKRVHIKMLSFLFALLKKVAHDVNQWQVWWFHWRYRLPAFLRHLLTRIFSCSPRDPETPIKRELLSQVNALAVDKVGLNIRCIYFCCNYWRYNRNMV